VLGGYGASVSLLDRQGETLVTQGQRAVLRTHVGDMLVIVLHRGCRRWSRHRDAVPRRGSDTPRRPGSITRRPGTAVCGARVPVRCPLRERRASAYRAMHRRWCGVAVDRRLDMWEL